MKLNRRINLHYIQSCSVRINLTIDIHMLSFTNSSRVIKPFSFQIHAIFQTNDSSQPNQNMSQIINWVIFITWLWPNDDQFVSVAFRVSRDDNKLINAHKMKRMKGDNFLLSIFNGRDLNDIDTKNKQNLKNLHYEIKIVKLYLNELQRKLLVRL